MRFFAINLITKAFLYFQNVCENSPSSDTFLTGLPRELLGQAAALFPFLHMRKLYHGEFLGICEYTAAAQQPHTPQASSRTCVLQLQGKLAQLRLTLTDQIHLAPD